MCGGKIMKKILNQLIKIFFLKNWGLLVFIVTMMISMISFYFHVTNYHDQLSYDQKINIDYIEKYYGKLDDQKGTEIEAIATSLNESTGKLLHDFQTGIIDKEEYLSKHHQLDDLLGKQGGFNLFYKQYLKVKSDDNLMICNGELVDLLSMNNFDYCLIMMVLFMIYMIFLRDSGENTEIYAYVCFGGRKYIDKARWLLFAGTIIIFIIITYGFKIWLLSRYGNLNFEISNISSFGKNVLNMTVYQYYLLNLLLLIIGSNLLAMISILLNKLIKRPLLILTLIFVLTFVIKAFFGYDKIILYFPFVSFLIPGNYYLGTGADFLAFDFNMLILEIISVITILIIFVIGLKKMIKFNYIILCFFILCGCSFNNSKIEYIYSYNSYQNIHFNMVGQYLHFDNRLIDLKTFNTFDVQRDPLSFQEIIDVFCFDQNILYLTEDERMNKKIYSLQLDDMMPKYIDSLGPNQNRNYLNINEEEKSFKLENKIYCIIGNQDGYLIIYPDRIENNKGEVLIKDNFSNCYSIDKDILYVLQTDNQVVKYSLKTKEKEIVKDILCKYFFVVDGKLYYQNLKDNKVYCNQELILDQEVNCFDIDKEDVYFGNNEGIYCLNRTTQQIVKINDSLAYAIKVTNDGKYICYLTGGHSIGKDVALNVIDKDSYQNMLILEA